MTNRGKTKNDYSEMIAEVLLGIKEIKMVTGDAWYSSRENLKFLKPELVSYVALPKPKSV